MRGGGLRREFQRLAACVLVTNFLQSGGLGSGVNLAVIADVQIDVAESLGRFR